MLVRNLKNETICRILDDCKQYLRIALFKIADAVIALAKFIYKTEPQAD